MVSLLVLALVLAVVDMFVAVGAITAIGLLLALDNEYCSIEVACAIEKRLRLKIVKLNDFIIIFTIKVASLARCDKDLFM